MNSTNKAVRARTESAVSADIGRNYLKCDICHEGFGIKSKLLKHYVQHGLTELFSCNICGLIFYEKSRLDKHYLLHQEVTNTYNCEKCQEKFLEKFQLDEHVLRVHDKYSVMYNERNKATLKKCDTQSKVEISKCEQSNKRKSSDVKNKIADAKRKCYQKLCRSKPYCSVYKARNYSESATIHLNKMKGNSNLESENRLSGKSSNGISRSSENIFIENGNTFAHKSCTVLINKLPHFIYKECIERGFISLKNYLVYALVSDSDTKVNATLKCNSYGNFESSGHTEHKISNSMLLSIKSPSTVISKSDLKTNSNSIPKTVNVVKSCQGISNLKQNALATNTNQNSHACNSIQNELKVSTAVNSCYTVVPGCPNKIKYVGPKQSMHLVDHIGNLEKILKRKILYGFVSTSARSSVSSIRTSTVSCVPQVSEKNIQFPVASRKNGKRENASQNVENNNSLPTSLKMSPAANVISNPRKKCGRYLIFDKNYAPGMITLPQTEGKNKSHDMLPSNDNVNETSNIIINSTKTVNILNPNKGKDSGETDTFNSSDQSVPDVNNSATSLDDIIFVPLIPEILNRIHGQNNRDIPKILQEMGYVPTVKKVTNISTVPVTPELLSQVQGKTSEDVPKMLKDVGFIAELKNISDTKSLTTEPNSLDELKTHEARTKFGKRKTLEKEKMLQKSLIRLAEKDRKKNSDTKSLTTEPNSLDELKTHEARTKFEKRKTLEKEKMLQKLLIRLAEKDRKKKKKYKEKRRRRLAEKENLSKWSSSDTGICRMEKEANMEGVQGSLKMQLENSNEIKSKKYFEKHVEKDMQKVQNYSKESNSNVKQVTYVEEKQHSLELEEDRSNGFKKQVLQKTAYSDSNQVDYISHASEMNLCKLHKVKFNERKTIIYSRGEREKRKDFSESVNDTGQVQGVIVSEKNVNKTLLKVSLSEPSELVQSKTTSEEGRYKVSRSDLEVSSLTQRLPSSKKAEDCSKDSFSGKSHTANEACGVFNGSSHKILCSSEISPKIVFDDHEAGGKTCLNKKEQNEDAQKSEYTTFCQNTADKSGKDTTLGKNAVSMQKSVGDKLCLKKSKNVQKLSKDAQKGSGIKTEAEKKVLKKFAEIDRRIKVCLSVSNINVNECLDAMNELDNLSISRGIWKESLKILQTLKKCRKFTKSEIVRQRASELYNKFIKFYMIPSAPVVNASN